MNAGNGLGLRTRGRGRNAGRGLGIVTSGRMWTYSIPVPMEGSHRYIEFSVILRKVLLLETLLRTNLSMEGIFCIPIQTEVDLTGSTLVVDKKKEYTYRPTPLQFGV